MALRGAWGWLVTAICVMAACALALLGLGVALDAGLLNGPALRYFAWKHGRTVDVKGALKLHLLSAHPWVSAEGLTLGNPPWTAPGPTADVERLEIHFGWRWSSRAGIDLLRIQGANLHLLRDTDGFANWQAERPRPGEIPKLPVIRALQLSDVHLYLNDALRHLEFDGYVSGGTMQADARLALEARGILNSKPVTLSLTGDELKSARAEVPYGFEFKGTSNGGRLSLRGTLPRPFETDLLDSTFEASGADLKDLYYLVGVRLVNTGEYHLAGQLLRRGRSTRFTDLSLTSGQSDLRGNVSIEFKEHRPQMDVTLHSHVLRMLDIGLRAAGRDPNGTAPPPVFSDAKISLSATRRMDVHARYAADRMVLGRFELASMQMQLNLDHGILDIPGVTGRLLQGKFSAHARLDVNQDAPAATVELDLSDAQLRALPTSQDPPPLDGPLSMHANITGRGLSVHEVVSSANGTVTARALEGTIRASLAELAGADLRGLGLALARSKRETVLRCARAGFHAQAGTLSADQIVVDTEPVVITGSGQIHLADETLDLRLQGQPKSARVLRLASPLAIKGTLRNPSISVQSHEAALKLFDRGTGQDVDCHSLP